MGYILLEWDTIFFGFKVAKIKKLTNATLGRLKNDGVKLAFFDTAQNNEEDELAKKLGGFLADQRVTYSIKLAKTVKNLNIVEYLGKESCLELDALAIQSGVFSKFNVDPNISKECFENLYLNWIKNSVNKQLAKAVLTYVIDQKIVGMVTIGERSGNASIGLIAVDEIMRGKSIGTALVKSSQNWCLNKGFKYGQVGTQLSNKGACRLYENCGYSIESVENCYHFWF